MKVSDRTGKTGTMRVYRLATYDERWKEMKKKYGLTDQQLRKEIEDTLQIQAWGDVLDEVERFIILENEEKEEQKDG